MNLFQNVNRFFQKHRIIAARMSMRDMLLLQSDAALARNGYSRERLEAGLAEWPWRSETLAGDTQQTASAGAQTPLSDAAAAFDRYDDESRTDRLAA